MLQLWKKQYIAIKSYANCHGFASENAIILMSALPCRQVPWWNVWLLLGLLFASSLLLGWESPGHQWLKGTDVSHEGLGKGQGQKIPILFYAPPFWSICNCRHRSCDSAFSHLSKALNSKTTWFAGCKSLLQCVYQFQAISWLFMRRGGQQQISRWFPERKIVSSSSKSPLCQRLPRPSSYGWIGSGLRWELAPSWIFLTNRYIVLIFWNILTTLTT